jgi:hypothetical protein
MCSAAVCRRVPRRPSRSPIGRTRGALRRCRSSRNRGRAAPSRRDRSGTRRRPAAAGRSCARAGRRQRAARTRGATCAVMSARPGVGHRDTNARCLTWPRLGERRPRSRKQLGDERRTGCEGEDRAVDRDFLGARREVRRERDEKVAQQPTDEQAEGAAGERQQRALGEQLPCDATTSGAERDADGELALASQNKRERQVGDVGRDQQQDEGGRRQQHQQRRPRLARQLVIPDTAAVLNPVCAVS